MTDPTVPKIDEFAAEEDDDVDSLDEDMGEFEAVGVEKDLTPDGGVKKKIVALGTGFEKPEPGDEVTVHYTGTLYRPPSSEGDAPVEPFDSSRSPGRGPFTFKLGQREVIKGWDVGVATMKRGEKAVFTLKPEYAYGDAGSGDKIPPKSTLVFDVELLSWKSFKDLTGDGGVIKTTTEPGSGWKVPGERDVVKVSYKLSKAKDGGETLAEARGVEFELGGENEGLEIPRGVVEAVRTMKKGERATLELSDAYGPTVGGARVAASGEVELASWQTVEEISPGLEKRTVVETESWTKPSPGSTVTVKLEGRVVVGEGGKGKKRETTVFLPETEVEFVVDDDGVGKVVSSSSATTPADAAPVEVPIPEGLDEAVRRLAERERAVVTASPEHAFGDKGLEALSGVEGATAVPPGASVEFEVELVRLVKAKESWEMDEPEKIAAAEAAKQAGNEKFKARKWSAAVKKYNRALTFVEYDSGFGADAKNAAAELKKACNLNLAAARLRTGDFRGAVSAADKVLERDGLNAKALYRRAQARLSLMEFVEAERDARVALAEDPTSADLRLLLSKIKKESSAYDRKQAKTFSDMFGRMAAMEAAEARKKREKEERERAAAKKEEEEKMETEGDATAAAATAAAATASAEDKMDAEAAPAVEAAA